MAGRRQLQCDAPSFLSARAQISSLRKTDALRLQQTSVSTLADIEVDVDIDRNFGCLKEVSKSV